MKSVNNFRTSFQTDLENLMNRFRKKFLNNDFGPKDDPFPPFWA